MVCLLQMPPSRFATSTPEQLVTSSCQSAFAIDRGLAAIDAVPEESCAGERTRLEATDAALNAIASLYATIGIANSLTFWYCK